MEEKEKKYQDEEIGLKDLWQIIKKRSIGILVIFIIVITIAYLITFLTPKKYESLSIIQMANSIKSENIIRDLQQPLTWKELSRIADDLGHEEPITNKDFKVIINDDYQLEIVSLGNSPEQAKKINEIIGKYIINYQKNEIVERERVENKSLSFLKEKITEIEKEILEIENKINQTINYASAINALQMAKLRKNLFEKELIESQQKFSLALETINVKVPANLPEKSAQPNKKLNLIIGTILGIFAGFSWAFIKELAN